MKLRVLEDMLRLVDAIPEDGIIPALEAAVASEAAAPMAAASEAAAVASSSPEAVLDELVRANAHANASGDEPLTGIGAHTDFEAFTLMHQSAPGLQLRSVARDARWETAPVRPGSLRRKRLKRGGRSRSARLWISGAVAFSCLSSASANSSHLAGSTSAQ